jgi:hypothetical protein
MQGAELLQVLLEKPYRMYRLLLIATRPRPRWDGLLVLRGLAVHRLWRCGSCGMQGPLKGGVPTPSSSLPYRRAIYALPDSNTLLTGPWCVIYQLWPCAGMYRSLRSSCDKPGSSNDVAGFSSYQPPGVTAPTSSLSPTLRAGMGTPRFDHWLTRMYGLTKTMAGSSFITILHACPLSLHYTIHSLPLKC